MIINNNYSYYSTNYIKPLKRPTFKSYGYVESVKNTNLGQCFNGLVGSVRVFKNQGEEVALNVFKHKDYYNETYALKDNLERIVGKIVLKINKMPESEKYYGDEDLNHVFVSELRNHSNPNTPYYFPELEEYKGVGTRLLQIAQKRSYEEMCNGNIELVSKNESLNFYKKLGFTRANEFSIYVNPNKLKLAEENKSKLFNQYGGLK